MLNKLAFITVCLLAIVLAYVELRRDGAENPLSQLI